MAIGPQQCGQWKLEKCCGSDICCDTCALAKATGFLDPKSDLKQFVAKKGLRHDMVFEFCSQMFLVTKARVQT